MSEETKNVEKTGQDVNPAALSEQGLDLLAGTLEAIW
jgi:hypothetical protein